MTNPSRRDILKTSAGLAAGAALLSLVGVAPAMADSNSMSAAEIVAAIRAKKITATEVANAAFARAEQVRDLNALIIVNRDPALAAAAEIDGWERPGPLPLAGLPIVIKDNINTADMPTSAGTPALQNAQPGRNAPSLQKLLKAGVIMIGKANMHELAFGITSTNLASFAGPVKNPYDNADTWRLFRWNGGGHRRWHRHLRIGIDTAVRRACQLRFAALSGLRPSVGDGAERRYRWQYGGSIVTPATIGPMGVRLMWLAGLRHHGHADRDSRTAARCARYSRGLLERIDRRRNCACAARRLATPASFWWM